MVSFRNKSVDVSRGTTPTAYQYIYIYIHAIVYIGKRGLRVEEGEEKTKGKIVARWGDENMDGLTIS
jgi:hypothetical protein